MTTKTEQKPVVVLACDPGKDNYAWAFVEIGTGCVVDTGMVAHTLCDLTFMQFVQHWRLHLADVKRLLGRNDVVFDALCVERLTPRPGMGAGANAEYVNLMIGALYVLARLRGIKRIVPVMPSTWKGWLARTHNKERTLESSPIAFGFPQIIKNERKSDNFPIKEHQFDAIGIGLWFSAHERFSLEHEPIPDPSKQYARCKSSLIKLWRARS